MNRPISIFSLTAPGAALANRMSPLLDCEPKVYGKPYAQPFKQTVQQAFKQGEALILICATGIAMRSLAPVLQSKLTDPPVLVLDEQGKFVIPLLSGHEGGANELASQVAKMLGSQLVLTTANSYLAPKYAMGMGCERGCSVEHLHEHYLNTLANAGLNPSDISSLHSIDIKHDEVGLIELAKRLNLPFVTHSAEQLNKVDHLLATRSDYIFKTVGVYGVAEAAALYGVSQHSTSSGTAKPETEPELVQIKLKTAKATCAIARNYFDETE